MGGAVFAGGVAALVDGRRAEETCEVVADAVVNGTLDACGDLFSARIIASMRALSLDGLMAGEDFVVVAMAAVLPACFSGGIINTLPLLAAFGAHPEVPDPAPPTAANCSLVLLPVTLALLTLIRLSPNRTSPLSSPASALLMPGLLPAIRLYSSRT